MDWASKPGEDFDDASQHRVMVFFYIKRVGVYLFKVFQINKGISFIHFKGNY